ncbi:hypothetical protein ACXHXG_20665 [Rhizobium sp. LEGMi198b]|uniref:hypothetical protein n=1 Tax=Rhizobium sp. CB3090 TaxID=3039156 RepID=UPI0024B0BB3A|nr:hypothetical protein [Rhizobium sp. CB3090]WFU13234.1 hypothetical protein QA646_29265 [Rhizobium sp. CB3090]
MAEAPTDWLSRASTIVFAMVAVRDGRYFLASAWRGSRALEALPATSGAPGVSFEELHGSPRAGSPFGFTAV